MAQLLPVGSRLAPRSPLILSPKTIGQRVLFSWAGGSIVQPLVDSAPTFAGSAAPVQGRYGSGFAFTGGADRVTYQKGLPLTSLNGGFTIEVLCAITATAVLSGFIANTYDGVDGAALRGILAYGTSQHSIYFWGGNNLDSGVDWRTDGLPQHVFITSDSGAGTTMNFYRDGLIVASGSTPSPLDALTIGAVQIGDTNLGWNATPTGIIYKAAYYDRSLSASEIWDKTQDPYGDYLLPSFARKLNATAAGADVLWAQSVM